MHRLLRLMSWFGLMPRRLRSAGVLITVSSLSGSGLVTVVGTAAIASTVAVTVTAAPAKASTSSCGNVLILASSVNGGTASAEYEELASLGCSPTLVTDTEWGGMTEADFASYEAIVIGDPSSGSCATTVPTEAASTAGTWGPAVNGNVAVLGTAPTLAGSAGSALLDDALSYAVATPGQTGLYMSLNCEYEYAGAGSPVPMLAYVDDSGVQKQQQFHGDRAEQQRLVPGFRDGQHLAGTGGHAVQRPSLGQPGPPWALPACSVQESFTAWPVGLNGLASRHQRHPGELHRLRRSDRPGLCPRRYASVGHDRRAVTVGRRAGAAGHDDWRWLQPSGQRGRPGISERGEYRERGLQPGVNRPVDSDARS